MDPSQIGNTLLGLALAVVSLGTALSSNTRKTRRRAKKLALEVDDLQTRWVEAIRERHRHNLEQHPDGEGAISIPNLPQSMRDIDEDDE